MEEIELNKMRRKVTVKRVKEKEEIPHFIEAVKKN